MPESARLLADRSDLARLRATGADALGLLHRLSTQDLGALAVGQGRPTVLTTPKGRILERLFVHRVADRDALLVAGPGRADVVIDHLRRYTFREEVALRDVTSETVQFALLGGGRFEGAPDPGPWGSIQAEIDEVAVTILGHDGFSSDGRSMVAPSSARDALRERLALRAEPVDAAAVETWRILRGHPAPGAELTEEYNPLEAGLRDHVSFTKGCYVGQEVVARLNTYDKVSRRVVGLAVDGAPDLERGAAVLVAGRSIGAVTSSAAATAGGPTIALAYVKIQEIAPSSTEVEIAHPSGPVRARLVELPFPDRP